MRSKQKNIAFLATGNEIVEGDVQDTNSHHFAHLIHENGGSISQRIQVRDNQIEIVTTLNYLFTTNDAIIIIGGLGPTSDDLTRFAIAEATGQILEFNDTAWQHIIQRLHDFDLAIIESNRQQALFPRDATLYQNPYGTAFGCHFQWQGINIFMLPGPPKECFPMFEQYVVPTLASQKFFAQKKTYRWLTLGLIEGEIATKVDAIAKSYKAETGYRWAYPYLEIKITIGINNNIASQSLIHEIDTLLLPALVSRNCKEATDVLNELLQIFPHVINIIDNVSQGQFAQDLSHPQLIFAEQIEAGNNTHLFFKITSSPVLTNEQLSTSRIQLKSEGYMNNALKYENELAITNRSQEETMQYAKAYIAWQLCQFMMITLAC